MSLQGRKLKLAYFVVNGIVTPVAPVIKGVLRAVDALRKAGHEVVPFEPMIDGVKMYNTSVSILTCFSRFELVT